MGKIIIPGEGAEGESKFFQLSVSTFVTQQREVQDADIQLFRKYFKNDKVDLYLTAIQPPAPGEENGTYELVAFHQEKKGMKSFLVTCDPNFQIKGIVQITPEKLTPESQEVVAEVKAQHNVQAEIDADDEISSTPKL